MASHHQSRIAHTRQDGENDDWRPKRCGLPVQTDPAVLNPIHVQESANRELVDLLRAQIAQLLEENEKILTTLDDYREQITILKREQNESVPDVSMEQLALQTELGEARLREAELTIAFGELQERITAIDRMIETDPEMEQFFNAVTISTTAMSFQKPSQRSTQMSQNTSPIVNDKRSNAPIRSHDTFSRSSLQRQFKYAKIGRIMEKNDYYRKTTSAERESHLEDRSGLESPQSDSGCSLNSHMTSEVFDPSTPNTLCGVEQDELRQKHFAASRSSGSANKASYHDEVDLDEEFGEDRTFKNERPKNNTTMLRRSRSSVTDNQYVLRNDFQNAMFPWDREDAYARHLDDTPTPADVNSQSDVHDGAEMRTGVGDRFSRLRASFRKSFGFGVAKPDFRMEAFAARQGEARALLVLRETRMELLRVQSRCQTLQRHVDRLEVVNASRMEELEASAACDRELRQDIRGLQRRIFELEAEHREYKVNQRIKEMELMSKLAEANLRLSHVELSNQQAVVWSELNKAHDVASNILSQGSNSKDMIQEFVTDKSRDAELRHTTITRENASPSVIRRRPTLDHSLTRLQSTRCSESYRLNQQETSTLSTSNDRTKVTSPTTAENLMEQSIGSLSDLRLQPDPP